MMYTEITATGAVLGWGDCPPPDVPHSGNGITVITGCNPPADRTRLWRWDGTTFVDDGPRFPTTYIAQRLAAYPSAGEQLDALWHAMDVGDTPKSEPWYSSIKAIKEAYPKS